VLAAIVNAVAIRKEVGSRYDFFGDPSLAPGVMPAMLV
jgi:hypothetical protein